MAHQETAESKIIWGIGRFFKNLFSGSGAKSRKDIINRQEIAERWDTIETMLKSGGPSHFQTAVIDADKLLDYCLKSLSARGETMGERLKSSEDKFHSRDSYQAAWEAHKERNRIVHEHDYEFLHHQAKAAINNFEKALRGLGAL